MLIYFVLFVSKVWSIPTNLRAATTPHLEKMSLYIYYFILHIKGQV